MADQLSAQAATVFQPRSPITTKDLFAGRWSELTEISDAVVQPGLHVVIYGERGVGKTSLANVVGPTIHAIDEYGDGLRGQTLADRLVVKTVANSGDTFSGLWRRLFAEVTWVPPAINGEDAERVSTTEFFSLPRELEIDNVRRVLGETGGGVFIVDEFDQAPRSVSRQFTELIKTLSDLAVDCTVILVGVSETVGNLVQDHASIQRAMAQVRLERMKPDELEQILKNAEKALQIAFEQDAAKLIVRVSQGLPHYTHLIGLNSVRSAAQRLSLSLVERDDVFEACRRAVKQAEQTVTESHSTAIHSSQRSALYRHVLLACALAAARSGDSLGYFNPSAVVVPLQRILQKPVTISTFNNHLREFCEEKRGSVLERDGQPWGFRYRFRNPLLVPYIFMDGVDAGVASGQELVTMLSGEWA